MFFFINYWCFSCFLYKNAICGLVALGKKVAAIFNSPLFKTMVVFQSFCLKIENSRWMKHLIARGKLHCLWVGVSEEYRMDISLVQHSSYMYILASRGWGDELVRSIIWSMYWKRSVYPRLHCTHQHMYFTGRATFEMENSHLPTAR